MQYNQRGIGERKYVSKELFRVSKKCDAVVDDALVFQDVDYAVDAMHEVSSRSRGAQNGVGTPTTSPPIAAQSADHKINKHLNNNTTSY